MKNLKYIKNFENYQSLAIEDFGPFEARKNTEQHIPCEYEKEIIDKIGRNKTNEKTFNYGIFIDEPEHNELLGFYTYRGQVCILDGLGMDVHFSEYSEDTKKIIHSNIINNNYK